MIKILLVDDHEIIRDGLRALLSGESDLKIVGECNDGEDVFEFVKSNEVDVVLMDINMPHMNGIDATKLVTDAFPEVKVIALTMHNEDAYITKVLKAGASGYIMKNTGRMSLISTIHRVIAEGNYFPEEIAQIMLKKFMKNGNTPKENTVPVSIDELTRREVEILQLIAEGHTNKDIADRLFISSRTVDTHRRNLLQKINVKNTAGLVRFAIQNNLID